MSSITHKYCNRCKINKPISEFNRFCRHSTGYQVYCRECHKPMQVKAKIGRYSKIKEKFFSLYGNKCACCGETIKEFLTIEHKKGQHGIKNKTDSLSAYSKALKVYNPSLYEVLCLNCNHAKGRFGSCPHKWDKYRNS